MRSLGGWAQVVSQRKKDEKILSDDRILGSRDFVERLLLEAEEKAIKTLRLRTKICNLECLTIKIIKREDVEETELRSGSRRPDALQARTLFCQIAVKKLGYFGAEVARYLGITTSDVNRRAGSKELPEIAAYLD